MIKGKLFLDGILSLSPEQRENIINGMSPEQAQEVRDALTDSLNRPLVNRALDSMKARILDYIMKNNEYVNLRSLRRDLSFSRHGTNSEIALSALQEEKQIMIIGKGTKDDPKMVGILKNSVDMKIK